MCKLKNNDFILQDKFSISNNLDYSKFSKNSAFMLKFNKKNTNFVKKTIPVADRE